MSQFPVRTFLDLSIGLVLYAVIRIKQQKEDGRKTIYEIGHIDSPVMLTLGLDDTNDLRVWLIDANEEEHVTDSISNKYFLNKLVLLTLEVIPLERHFFELVIGINNEHFSKTKLHVDLGSQEMAAYMIGANLIGNENAAFALQELSQYEGTLNEGEKAQLLEYVQQRYGVLDDRRREERLPAGTTRDRSTAG